MGFIHGQKWSAEPDIQVGPEDRADGLPVLLAQVMPESGLLNIGFLILLEHQGIRQGDRRAQGALDAGFIHLCQ